MELLTSDKVTYGAVWAVALFIAALIFGGGISLGAVVGAVVAAVAGFIIGMSAAGSE